MLYYNSMYYTDVLGVQFPAGGEPHKLCAAYQQKGATKAIGHCGGSRENASIEDGVKTLITMVLHGAG